MTKPRHAKVRADFWSHDATSWMAPIHRSIYMHAAAHTILGIVEMSPRKLATIHEGKGNTVTSDDIETAIADLTSHEVAVWWPDHEILWVVNAADENITGRGTAQMWQAAHKQWRTLPVEVRGKVADKYPQVCNADNVPRNRVFGASKNGVCSGSESESESEGVGVSEFVNDPSPEAAARNRAIDAERVAEAVAYLTPPQGLRALLTPRDRIARLLADGATVDEVIATVTALRDAVDSGQRQPDQWRGQYVFSGYFDSLRNELLSERGPRF